MEGQPALNQTLVCFIRGVKRFIIESPRHTLVNSQTQALVEIGNTLAALSTLFLNH